jgi:hypothetical protein
MDHHAAYAIGAAFAQLGQQQQAMKWLTRATETGLPCYPWFERDPLLNPLRTHSEFQHLLEKLKAYWESANSKYVFASQSQQS